MSNRWDRLGPLLGVGFVVLLVVDFLLSGSEPATGTSAAKVVAWYSAHHSNVKVAGYLMVPVLVVGLLFYGYLRDRLADGASGLAATAFGGAVLFAVSGAVAAGVQLALVHTPAFLSSASVPTLNLLSNYLATIAVGAGAAVLLIAASLAILRTAQLPAWIGWLGLAFGVVALLPVRNLGPIPAGIWTLIVCVTLLVRRPEMSVVGRPGTAQAAPGGAR